MEVLFAALGMASGLICGIILGFSIDHKIRMMLYDKIKKLENEGADDDL